MFNISVVNYPDFSEVSCYSKPIASHDEVNLYSSSIYPDRPRKASPGCRLIPVKEIVRCPFDGEFIYEEFLDSDELEERRLKNIHDSQKRAHDKCRSKCLSNHWDWFVTFTFDDNKAPSAGVDFERATYYSELALKDLRKVYGKFDYVLVAEQGEKNGRWHFHALVSGLPSDAFVFSGKCDRKTHEKIYNLPDWKYGFTTATRVRSSKAVSRYIIKYITKCDSVPFGSRRFRSSHGLSDASKSKIKYLFDNKGKCFFRDSCSSISDFAVRYSIPVTDNSCMKMYLSFSDLQVILSLLDEDNILFATA